MATFEKLVLVTRKTRLAELLERLPTKGRAKFYLKQQNLDFDDYDEEDATYQRAVDQVQSALHGTLKVQVLDRALLPTFLFSEKDVVVTLGQDGLVANAAKYVGAQPLIGVNPDPGRFDGVLLPFAVSQARAAVERVLSGRAAVRQVTLAEARLRDGQRLLAFNDLYVGAQTHVSARYHLRAAQGEEKQSSSGVIVSTGAGSTGWLSSVFNMASNVSRFLGTDEAEPLRLQWEDPRLIWVVREPFVSRHSSARFTAGYLEPGASLSLESLMPQGGVIFGDGMEKDFLAFNSGAVAELHAASVRARLVAA
jgi:NAD kinase